MIYKEIDGDLIKLAKTGMFDVIVHGCNCFCTMKRGLAPKMVKAFGVDEYSKEHKKYAGDINKLGTIEYGGYILECSPFIEGIFPNNIISSDTIDEIINIPNNISDEIKYFTIVNAYTQYGYKGEKCIDYDALTLCLRKINKIFEGKHIGLPRIGCGLAGGQWDIMDLPTELEKRKFENLHLKDVKTIIKDELKNCNVTIVNYKS